MVSTVAILVAEGTEIADAYGLVDIEDYTTDQVLERRLDRQRDRETAYTEAGEHAQDRQAQCLSAVGQDDDDTDSSDRACDQAQKIGVETFVPNTRRQNYPLEQEPDSEPEQPGDGKIEQNRRGRIDQVGENTRGVDLLVDEGGQ